MKELCLVTFIFIGFFSHAQIINIPDINFKNALLFTNCVDLDGDGLGDIDADTNDDGEIQVTEAEAILGLFISNHSITTLDGIENFSSLEGLWCYNNELTSLDLSQNPNLVELNCSTNFLVDLNISQNANLSILDCGNNDLNNINVSQNTNLQELYCGDNPITGINLSQNPDLESLSCQTSEIASLDLSQNPNLKFFVAYENELSSIDLSQNLMIEEISIDYNQITEIDLSQNTALRFFSGHGNQLSDVDVSQNPNLTGFYAILNELISLNLKNGNNDILESVWVFDNPNLECIEVDDVDYANNAPDWMKDDIAIYSEICLLGIESNKPSFSFSLFPNPAQDILNIQSNVPIEEIKLFSTSGKLLHKTSDINLDVTGLASGLYFLSITANNHTITRKFLKN